MSQIEQRIMNTGMSAIFALTMVDVDCGHRSRCLRIAAVVVVCSAQSSQRSRMLKSTVSRGAWPPEMAMPGLDVQCTQALPLFVGLDAGGSPDITCPQ